MALSAVADGSWWISVVSNARWNFIAMMPQWEFLDFVADEARAYPNFKLLMGSEATGFALSGSKITGVVYRQAGKDFTIVLEAGHCSRWSRFCAA